MLMVKESGATGAGRLRIAVAAVACLMLESALASPCARAQNGADLSVLAKNVLALRYPDGRRTTPPAPPRIARERTKLVITSERARLVFSTKRAAVIEATLMGRRMPFASIPDALVIDAKGRAYRQRDATDGSLEVKTTPADKYIHLTGACTPRGKSGPAPVRLRISYDIRKVTGFTIVKVSVEPKPGARIREFAMEHSVGPRATQLLPWLQMMENGLLAQVDSSPPDKPGVIYADTLPFALWSNGAMGLEVTSIDYANAVIDPSYLAVGERHYMTVCNRDDGSRAIDMVFIRVPKGKEVALKPGTTFTYALSFLPWRKFRPLYELYTGRFDVGVSEPGQPGDNPDPRVPAREGITTAFNWDVVFNVHQRDAPRTKPRDLEHELYWIRQANRCGMQHMQYVDHMIFLPRFVQPTTPALDRLWDWSVSYPDEQVREDILENRWTARDYGNAYNPDGIAYSRWPLDPKGYVTLCINSRRAQDFFFNSIKDYCSLEPTGLVYIDDYMPAICSNARHGCSRQGRSMSIGNHQLVERLHDLFQGYSPKIRLVLHMQSVFNNSVSLADYTNPGEQVPGGIPGRAELDIVYSPFLRGSQIIWYTASSFNKRNNDIRTYESALSRCGLVLHNWTYPPLTDEQKKWFARYLCPLAIYDVERSTVRHPLEPEYEDYVEADTERITPVVYERPGDVLLVVVKNGDKCEPKPVTIKAAPLGLKGAEVLVFDTIARRAYRAPVREGKILLDRVRVDEGPQIFRILNVPGSPSVLWHDQVAWRVMNTRFGFITNQNRMFEAQVCGVPESESVVYVYCPDGKPRNTGDELIDWDADSKIATCRVAFDKNAIGRLLAHW